MIKYANNAWHALKVCFANEIGNLCKRLDIDSHDVMDIFCRDRKLNLSPYYLKPGFAFGGSCLPKDVRALQYRAKEVDLEMPVLQAILPSNQLQIQRAVEEIIETGKKRIGLLGFSFKAGTDDLRESPLVMLAEVLLGKGYRLRIYDRNVALARLVGANKEYIERQIPHLSSLMCDTVEEVVDECDVLVVGNGAPEFADALRRTRPGQNRRRSGSHERRLVGGPGRVPRDLLVGKTTRSRGRRLPSPASGSAPEHCRQSPDVHTARSRLFGRRRRVRQGTRQLV